jgi:hypothetical protein
MTQNTGFAKDTLLLMYDGTEKKIQDIVVGDKIMTDTSTFDTVTKIFTGESDMVDIIPKRGEKYTVTTDTTLVLKASSSEYGSWDKKKKNYSIKWLEKYKIKSKGFLLENYNDEIATENEAKRYLKEEVSEFENYIGYGDILKLTVKKYIDIQTSISALFKSFTVGLDHKENELDLDPYMLGYWLGDGTSASTDITTADHEIVTYLHSFAKKHNITVIGPRKYRYAISTGEKTGKLGRNPFRNLLNKYNLLNNKHIPNIYKFNSRKNRLSLLAGLIDSDGYLGSNVYEFTFKSKKLADDVVFLSRSLGFFSYAKKVKKTCTNSSKGSVTGDYYRFHICGAGLEEIPVLLARKKAHKRLSPKNPCVNGIEISEIRQESFFGFKLQNNSNVLLNNFTVVRC